MAKLEVLRYNQILLTWLGIHSNHIPKSENVFKKYSGYFIFTQLIATIVSNGIFVYQNGSQIKLGLEACLIVIGAMQCGGSFLNIAIKMKKIEELRFKLQEIIDKGIFFLLIF